MKQFKKLTLLSVAVSSAMVLSACGSGSSVGKGKPITPTNTLDITYDKKVEYLTVQEAIDIQKVVYQDNKMNIQVANNHTLATKKSGDIVFIPAIKEGYFDTIVVVTDSTKNSDGTVTVATRRATPAEAFEKVNLNIDTRKAKAEIQSIILPTGEIIDIRNIDKHKGMQAGLLGVSLPDIQIIGSNEDDGKFQLKISQAMVTSKNRYVTDQQCREKAISYLNTKKSARYSTKELGELEQWKERNCHAGFTVSGTLDLKAPQLVTNIDMQRANTTDFIFNATDLNKMTFDNLHISGEIIGEIGKAEHNFTRKIDHSNLYKEFEKRQIGSQNGLYYGSLSGLSADDKKGKIPLFGFVLGVVPKTMVGHEANSTIRANQMAGLVVQVYGVLKATIDGKVEWKVELQPTTMDVGVELKDNEWQMVSHVKSVNTNQNGIDLAGGVQAEATVDTALGIAVDGDFLLGGVRLANAGAELRGIGFNAKTNGSVMLHTREPHLRVEGCLSNATIHGGLKYYGNIDIKGNFRAGIGWAKAEGGLGASFSYKSPTDETKPGYGWWATSIKDVCFSTVPPQIKIESVEYDEKSNRVKDGFMPLNIKVKNNSKGSIAKWFFVLKDIKTNKIIREVIGIVDDDGNFIDAMGDKFEIPQGSYAVSIKAVDFNDKVGISQSTPVSFTDKSNIYINNVSIQPQAIIIGQSFELVLIGQNLPINRMLNVQGCNAQTKVSLLADKHIYKCTAPTMATKNHKLVVFGADGKQQYYTTKLEIHQSIPISANALEFLSEPRYYLESDNSRYSKFLFTKGAYNNGMTSYVLNDVEYQKNGNKWIIDGENRDNLKVKGNDIFLGENNTFIGKAIVSKINDLSTQGFPKGSKSYNILLTNLQDEYDIFDNENYIYQNIGSIDNLLNNYQTINHSSGNTLWLDNLVNGYEAVFTFDKSSNQTNGTVQIYQANYKNGNFQQTKLGTGTWQRVKINGNDMIKVQPSKALYSKFDDLNQDGVARIYVKRSNERGVREGEFRAKGVQDNDLFYNKIAINHLMNKNKLPVVVD